MSNSSQHNKNKQSPYDSPSGQPTPDWLNVPPSQTPPSNSEPDWLKSIQAGGQKQAAVDDDPFAGMSDLERLLAEEGIDLGQVEDDRPDESVGMSAREWLILTSDDELVRKASSQSDLDDELDLTLPPDMEPDVDFSATYQAPATNDDPFAGMSDLERLLAEEGIDLGQVEDDKPTEAEGISARDWLIMTSDDELVRRTANTSEEVDLSFIPDAPVETPPAQPASAPAPTSQNNDPLAEMSDLERLLAEEGIAFEQLEDDRPAESAGMSAREWLIATSEDELVRKSSADISPELLQNVGEPISTQEEDDLPDWLQDVSEEVSNLSQQEPSSPPPTEQAQSADAGIPDWLTEEMSSTDSSSASGEDELPDWLRNMDEEPASEASQTAPSAAGQPHEEGDLIVVEDELPDWLRGGDFGDEPAAPVVAQTSVIPEPPPSTDDDIPDWLFNEANEADEPAQASAAPTTAEVTSAGNAEDDLLIVNDELPDWLQDLDENTTSDAPLTSAPVAEMGEPEGDLLVVDDELPDWLQAEDSGSDTPATTSAESDIPDWLQEEQNISEQSASDQISADDDLLVVGDELPDWLRGDDEPQAEPAIQASSADDGTPDWFQDVAETEASDTPLIDDTDLPDWLQDVSEEAELTTSALTPVDIDTPSDDAVAGLPDWLQDAADDTEDNALIEPLVDATAEVQDDLPDWLREMDGDDEPAVVKATPVTETPIIAEDDLPDWLQDEQDSVGASVAAAPSSDTDMPDWLKTEADTSFAVAPATNDTADTDVTVEADDLPSWLKAEADGAADTDAPLSFDEPDDVVDEVAVVPTVDQMTQQTALVSQAVTPPTVTETAPSQPTVNEPPIPEPTVPVVVTPYTGDLPEWLQKLRAGDQGEQEVGQQGRFVVPVPISAPILVAQAQAAPMPSFGISQTGTTTPPPVQPTAAVPFHSAETEGQLNQAQQAVEDGNLDQALEIYQTVVNQGYGLNQVIDTLQPLAQQNPKYALLQLLGDAMARDGRLQSALQVYRQAMTTLAA